MTVEPLRIGLLSTARINREIVRAAAGSVRVEVVAIASRSADRADAYARLHAIPRTHGSYEALLADDLVEALYVSLPNGLHHEWTMRALEAGKHVLCEKPYSRHPADVTEAFDAASREGLVLTEAFMYRHHPQTAIVQRLVSEGRIGRVVRILTAFTFLLEDSQDVRFRPELAGGALMDVGCYCVSGSRLLAGEPESAEGVAVPGPTGVDVESRGTLRFPGGAVAELEASFRQPRRQQLVVEGDDATLVVEAPWRVDWGGSVEIRRNGDVERIAVPAADAYALQLDNLADAVRGVARPLLGREDALGQARAIDALYRAAESGSPAALT